MRIIGNFVVAAICAGVMDQAQAAGNTLVMTMTNDPVKNEVLVLDGATHALLVSLPTGGKGGVAGNAGGVRQWAGWAAAVNNGSNTVTLFARGEKMYAIQAMLATSSAPVSVAFSADHLYVAGATTVDSFRLHEGESPKRDGTAELKLVGGMTPPAGSTAQIGVVGREVLVTLKTDPIPGTVDVLKLAMDGAVSGTAMAVSAPAGSLTPFGFSALPDGTAFITLAHSGQVGLFRNDQFTAVVTSGGQAGPCWTARMGKYLLIVNAGSKTVSREVSTGANIFVDAAVAAPIVSGGGPTDTDAGGGKLVVLDHDAHTSHLSFFKVDAFGDLTADGSPVDLAVPNANGVGVSALK